MIKISLFAILVLLTNTSLAGQLTNLVTSSITHKSGTEKTDTTETKINKTTVNALYNLNYGLKNTELNLAYLLSHDIDEVNDTRETDDQLNLNLNSQLNITKDWSTSFSSSIEQKSESTTGRQLGDDDSKKHFSRHIFESNYNTNFNKQLAFSFGANIQTFGFESENSTETIALSTRLGSATSSNKFNWSTSYQSNTENAFEDHIDSASLTLGYQFNKHFQTFINSQSFNSQDSTLESRRDAAGFLWTISNRSSVRLDLGQFEESDTWSLNVNLRSKRTRYQINHTETITNSSLALSQLPEEIAINEFLGSNQSVVTFLEKRDSITMQHEMRRLNSQINYFESSRFSDFNDTALQDIKGYIINLSYQLGRNSRLNYSSSLSEDNSIISAKQKSSAITWSKSKLNSSLLGKNANIALNYSEIDNKSTERNTIKSASFNWSLAPNKYSTVSFQLKKSEQTSDVIANNYQQDEINLTYQHAF